MSEQMPLMPQPEYNPTVRPQISTQDTLEDAQRQAADVANYENTRIDEEANRKEELDAEHRVSQTESLGGSIPPIDNDDSNNPFESKKDMDKVTKEKLRQLGDVAVGDNLKIEQ